jgi:two-component system, OmpR family, response regulator MprA
MATIPIVDDERPLRELLVAVFEDGGYRTIQARNGRQALELVAAERPDAVRSDVLMQLMGGPELCRRVKEDAVTRDLPVVLMSATDARRTAGAAGADEFVAKPFDLDHLLVLLARLVPAA